jgi:NAD(P)-dependent dehydrogenase (short-subunit alcohol dehydrogenase family)
VKTDVGIESECRQLITKAAEKFGRIDVLINNAGKSAQALFSEVADLGWYQELMRINFWGSVWCTHAALPYLKQSAGTSLRFHRWPDS